MFNVEQIVLFKKPICACSGGGTTESVGRIVGVLFRPQGTWYQIDQVGGIVTVKETDIIRIIDDVSNVG